MDDDLKNMITCMEEAGYVVEDGDYLCGFKFKEGWVFACEDGAQAFGFMVGIFYDHSLSSGPDFAMGPVKTWSGGGFEAVAVAYAEGFAQALVNKERADKEGPLMFSLRGTV